MSQAFFECEFAQNKKFTYLQNFWACSMGAPSGGATRTKVTAETLGKNESEDRQKIGM